jgi:hypothetical protein
MTNEERLAKITEAERLIREVEFSYPVGHDIRTSLYRLVVYTFSFLGPMPSIVKAIKNEEKAEKDKQSYEQT